MSGVEDLVNIIGVIAVLIACIIALSHDKWV